MCACNHNVAIFETFTVFFGAMFRHQIRQYFRSRFDELIYDSMPMFH